MLVFNPEWEKLKIPLALEEMIKLHKRSNGRVFFSFQFFSTLTNMDVGCFENRQTCEGQMEDAMQVDFPPQPTATANFVLSNA
jgi:hypothetical protein